MEYPKLNLGVSLPIFALQGIPGRRYPSLPCLLLWKYWCHHLYLALCEKEFLDSNRNTNRIPLNQLRRVSQPHLVLRCYPTWHCWNSWPA